MHQIARGVPFISQEPNGKFRSKYYDNESDEKFESIYYPGEAILALTRLYNIDRNPTWLNAAIKGAEWLITVRDKGKSLSKLPHDHWLLMALNELYAISSIKLFQDHALRLAQAILMGQRTASARSDWVGSYYDPPRCTPTATRGEALVAAYHLACRSGLKTVEIKKALDAIALFQLRCQFTQSNAFFLPRPDLALGGFRESLENWQVRIDYNQHNISALLGLRSILLGATSCAAIPGLSTHSQPR